MLTSVSVIGETPFGLATAVSTPPYQFSITVPGSLKIRAGKYRLTALGGRPNGRPFAVSVPIMIDVEPSQQPTALRVEPKVIEFRKAGEAMTLSVFGTFADGTSMRLEHSTAITYTAFTTSHFTVTNTGVVKAGPMKRKIMGTVLIQYGNLHTTVAIECNPITDQTLPSSSSSLSPRANGRFQIDAAYGSPLESCPGEFPPYQPYGSAKIQGARTSMVCLRAFDTTT
jgi:hypothetical protein